MNLAGKHSRMDQRSQPAGVPGAPREGGAGHAPGSDDHLLALHARLVELVSDAEARAELLGVTSSVDGAWLAGRMLPVLRAKAKALRAIVDRLERDSSGS